jgi:hypothetical protein
LSVPDEGYSNLLTLSDLMKVIPVFWNWVTWWRLLLKRVVSTK